MAFYFGDQVRIDPLGESVVVIDQRVEDVRVVNRHGIVFSINGSFLYRGWIGE